MDVSNLKKDDYVVLRNNNIVKIEDVEFYDGSSETPYQIKTSSIFRLDESIDRGDCYVYPNIKMATYTVNGKYLSKNDTGQDIIDVIESDNIEFDNFKLDFLPKPGYTLKNSEGDIFLVLGVDFGYTGLRGTCFRIMGRKKEKGKSWGYLDVWDCDTFGRDGGLFKSPYFTECYNESGKLVGCFHNLEKILTTEGIGFGFGGL